MDFTVVCERCGLCEDWDDSEPVLPALVSSVSSLGPSDINHKRYDAPMHADPPRSRMTEVYESNNVREQSKYSIR